MAHLSFEMVLTLAHSGVPYSQHKHYAALIPAMARELQQAWNVARMHARRAGEYIPIRAEAG